MKKNLAVFVATEYEDTELISSLDVFARNEVTYDLFSVENLDMVKGKFEAIVKTKRIDDFKSENYDGLFLPGGPGHVLLTKSDKLIATVKEYKKQGKFLTAICAAPEVFVQAEIIDSEIITSFPGFADAKHNTGAEVEVYHNIVTGRDFKSTIAFAEAVVKTIKGH